MGFGPRKPRDCGEVAAALCPNCGNHVTFHLLETRNWFSVFFVPLVPGRARHVVFCPICHYGVQVEGTALDAARELVEMTAAQQSQTVDPVAYRATVDAFWSMLGGERLANAGDAQPAPPSPSPGVRAEGPAAAPPATETAAPSPPAGWYTDPFGEADERYWDGERWTAGTNPPSLRS